MKICSHIRGECISSSGCALYVRVQGAATKWGKSMMVELTMEKTLLCEGNATKGLGSYGQIQDVLGCHGEAFMRFLDDLHRSPTN